jgi:hypothetical protein
MTDYHIDRPAGFWIGHPGALLALPGIKGSLARTSSRDVSYTTSASGRTRAYLAARRTPLRQWKVTIPRMQPQEAAVLLGLLVGTDPPYLWVDPWSRLTNLLTPDAVALTGSVPALAPLGRQPLAEGGYAPTGGANPTAAVVNLPPAPVVPDQPVTVSAYLGSTGQAGVSARWLNSNGAIIGAITSTTVTGVLALNRASVSVAAPPVTAAAVAIRIDGASVIAHPAVTWTAAVTAFGAGGGASQVIVASVDETIRAAELAATGDRLTDLSFTVVEVG